VDCFRLAKAVLEDNKKTWGSLKCPCWLPFLTWSNYEKLLTTTRFLVNCWSQRRRKWPVRLEDRPRALRRSTRHERRQRGPAAKAARAVRAIFARGALARMCVVTWATSRPHGRLSRSYSRFASKADVNAQHR